MSTLTNTLDRADAERMVREWIDAHVQTWEYELDRSGYAYLTPAEAQRMGSAPARELDDLLRVAGTDLPSKVKGLAQAALSGRDRDAVAYFEPIVSAALTTMAPGIDRTSQAGTLLARTLIRGFASYVSERATIGRGDFEPIPKRTAQSEPKPSTKPSSSPNAGWIFLQHWQAFETAKIREREWKPDTLSNARASRKLWDGLIGEMTIDQVDRKCVATFRALLLQLPRLYDKERRWQCIVAESGTRLGAVIKAADGFDEASKTLDRLARMKPRTADKHFNNLIEYWRYCQNVGLIPSDTPNPFTGFVQGKPRGRAARHERNAWPQEMVVRLFTSPVWTGCKNLQRRREAGPHIYRDARFWVPLWGRFTGLREDEICSRKVGDIAFQDGIAVLRIRNSKTPESERDLPLPDALLRMGFLEHRYHGRAVTEPIFPELMPQGPGLRRSAAFSGWFTEYRKGIDCHAPLVDFHSFRHNVSTDLQNVEGLSGGWADEITGHDSPIRVSERARYAKGVYARHLKATLDKIDIGVDLHHLDYDGPPGVAAPGSAEDRARFVALAERDMALKATRRQDAGK